MALSFAAFLGHAESNLAEVERSASDLIELSTRQNFSFWLAQGGIHRGWARCASGNTDEGISWIEDGIRNRATGSMLRLPYFLALKPEALHLTHRTREALEAIKEAEGLVERFEERWWCVELHLLRRIPPPKSERVRRTWIPTTSLLTPKGKIQKVGNKVSVALRITRHNPFYDWSKGDLLA